MRTHRIKTYLILALLFIFLNGCGIFSSDDPVYDYPACELPIFEWHNHLPNFGFEEGYYEWYNEGFGELEIKKSLLRNRNHLSIRFYEEYGKAFHDSVLAAHNIKPLWSQTFGLPVPMPGFYRVKDKPAEFYYTTYGNTKIERLGNLPEVEFVLPTYYQNEWFCDLSNTPIIMYSFHDFITEQKRQALLDSLQVADRVELRQFTPGEDWSPFHFYVTKESRLDPYELYHHYYQEFYVKRQILKSISPNFAQTARN